MDWYLQVLKKYTDFSGRARRKEYWMFALVNAFIAVALLAVGLIAFDTKALYYIYCLAVAIPGIAVSVRRLHDIGKSGFWFFISFVPIIGGIWMLILLCIDGQPEANAYGENQKA